MATVRTVDQLADMIAEWDVERVKYMADAPWNVKLAEWLFPKLLPAEPSERAIEAPWEALWELIGRYQKENVGTIWAFDAGHGERSLVRFVKWLLPRLEPSVVMVEAAWEQWAGFAPEVGDPKPRTLAVIGRMLRAAFAAQQGEP